MAGLRQRSFRRRGCPPRRRLSFWSFLSETLSAVDLLAEEKCSVPGAVVGTGIRHNRRRLRPKAPQPSLALRMDARLRGHDSGVFGGICRFGHRTPARALPAPGIRRVRSSPAGGGTGAKRSPEKPGRRPQGGEAPRCSQDKPQCSPHRHCFTPSCVW